LRMDVLIIEDEKLALDYLEKLVLQSSFEIKVIGRVDSVKNAIKWFLKNPAPELIFMDIDLGDGLCFEIFEVIDLKSPIIFTTAYDEYAIQAFKVNSVDYLLKPVNKEELEQAVQKHTQVSEAYSSSLNKNIEKAAKMVTKGFKERFIIKIGEHLKTLTAKEIGFIFSRDKASYAVTLENRNYLIDYTLDNLEGLLDSKRFFRINRKYIVSYKSIKDIITYSNSRLRLILNGSEDNDIIVSRDRVNNFKSWLDR